MDTLRGHFGSIGYDNTDGDSDCGSALFDLDAIDEDVAHEGPPAAIGTDERRMQVRAYNHWASQLDERALPSIEDLEPEDLTDFGPYSVLLDFTAGIDNPGVQYLGPKLAEECGADVEISELADVPSRSLLSRITDHYMQIIANQAPIGFEAEFVNQRGATILYRGILLPYSSDGDTIDFIYGVINWKELADQITTDELLLEIDQALDGEEPQAGDRSREPIEDWADGPGKSDDEVFAALFGAEPMSDDAADDISETDDTVDTAAFPAPQFGGSANIGDVNLSADENSVETKPDDDIESDESGDQATIARLSALIQPPVDTPSKYGTDDSLGFEEDETDDDGYSGILASQFASPAPYAADPLQNEISSNAPLDAPADPDAGLYDCLADARELASRANSSENRTRQALYAAIGRAYDVSLAARTAPAEFAELMEDNGLVAQERAPMTPVVKLVFGADYDKTRLTEYAAVLSHAQRVGMERGALSNFLAEAEGGLKAVVKTERRLRKEDVGVVVMQTDSMKPTLLAKLRAMETRSFTALESDGEEFAMVMIRRMPDGDIAMLGEIANDIVLVEKIGRKLLAQ